MIEGAGLTMAVDNYSRLIQSGIHAGGGGQRIAYPTNQPPEYKDRARMYFERQSQDFRMEKLRYASDMINAQAQGLYPDAPEAWTPCRIRMADTVRPSAAIRRDFDEYKLIIMEDPRVNYVPPGCKFVAMGSTWLMINPLNVSQTDGSGIVRRCHTTWNHLDYYGNILKEPLVVENDRASASDSDEQEFQLTTRGYFNITCQYNSQTRQLNTNSKMLLGKGAYRVTGFSDFQSEFTEDDSAVKILRFVVRYEEPNERTDDLVHRVAGGKEFSWVIGLSGSLVLNENGSGALTPTSTRNGTIVVSTAENPVSYLWSSDNSAVCAVDEAGNLTAGDSGNAVITCTLEQNPSIQTSVTVTVEAGSSGESIRFAGTVPGSIRAYESLVITATHYVDGNPTTDAVSYSCSGADIGSYTTTQSGNTLTVNCWGGSVTPLTITARSGDVSASAEVTLIGI